MKKKIMIIFVSVMIIIFLLINYMVINNNKYNNKLGEIIKDNTDIKDIKYINKYDKYYIVKDSNYLYLVTSEYDILLEIDLSLIHDNKNKYDIIYQNDLLMYFNDYYEDGKLVYEYYDIYSYELIDRVFVGG